jgi:hypothetical protein
MRFDSVKTPSPSSVDGLLMLPMLVLYLEKLAANRSESCSGGSNRDGGAKKRLRERRGV